MLPLDLGVEMAQPPLSDRLGLSETISVTDLEELQTDISPLLADVRTTLNKIYFIKEMIASSSSGLQG